MCRTPQLLPAEDRSISTIKVVEGFRWIPEWVKLLRPSVNVDGFVNVLSWLLG